MPQFFIGDTFGLNTVYDGQVLNVEQKNFSNWIETATYGYFGGGDTSATTSSSTIDRIDFFNEVVSLPGKNLPAIVGNSIGVYNISYGYFGGGDTPTPSYYSTIIRLDLSTESISLPGKNLPSARSSMGSVSSSSYGYFGGGYVPVTGRVSVIVRIDFSTESASLPGNNLPQARNTLSGVSNLSYGYLCGGLTPPPAALGRSSVVDRLDFTTEIISTPTLLQLSSNRSNSNSTFNSYYGYIGGGQLPASRVSTIDRLDFTTEITSLLGTTLFQGRSGGSGTSSISYGYYSGGILGPPATATRASSIDRLDFSTGTSTSTGKNLTQARGQIASFSAGQSINRGSKTYGYFGGGNGIPSIISTISRLDFSSEIVSDPGKNLPVGRIFLAAVSNNSYGYFGGGLIGSGFPTHTSIITRLDFSNETVSDPGKNLPTARERLAAVSSGSYGYFGGGISGSGYPGSWESTISRLDFSNESISNPGKNLYSLSASGVSDLAVTSSNSYGYFGGGYYYDSSSELSDTYNTIVRLDFSNETISLPGKNLPSNRYTAEGVSNNFYGYFAGGGIPAINTITRLDFSNETVSNPSKNLPTTRIYFAATSSSYYGYFGGDGAISNNTISRLDFSNETVSDPGKNFLTSRGSFAAVSNSN